MNRHQVLSGACNAGDRCYAVGSVEGIPFTAYAAGCNIVILASTFERVQIIPGATHGYIKISALDCSTDTGKIAAAYEDKICIFEPTPVIQNERPSTHNLDYRWVQTGSFSNNSNVTTLSWNLEGTRLLTGGGSLQMWREKVSEDNESQGVKFEIGGGDRDVKTPTNESTSNETAWESIWSCQTAIPVYHMAFSPDGTLFATSGRNDRLVKIWYENKHVLFPTKSFDASQFRSGTFDDTDLNYTYVYIAHPRAVTNISWRKTSKYMPKGSVSNMLVTSCLDNICRIWIETVLPDDGLVNMTQFDPLASQNPKFRTHRHKHRFMQRLKHMKTCFHIRRHAKNGAIIGNIATSAGDSPFRQGPIPSLPSSYSVHDFHSYGFHGTGVSPGMHFHLAASINAETDIPLVPSMQTSDPSNQNNFILHWLNNKEMHFSLQAEGILQELTRKIIDREDNNNKTTTNLNGPENHMHMEDPVTEAERREDAKKKFAKSVHKSFSIDESNSDEHSSSKHSGQHGPHGGASHLNSISNTTSLNSLAPDNNPNGGHIIDSLDMKIDCLLRDWHHSPDLLYSIHPIDGSYLIWVIEWLDDYYPGSFRQAQVSFSTRIPGAFPLGDAMSMSTMVSLYNTGASPLNFREMVKSVKKNENIPDENGKDPQSLSIVSEEQEVDEDEEDKEGADNEKKEETGEDQSKGSNSDDMVNTVPSPTVSMVTKHSNGTLNLWQLTFSYKTKFTQVLSIGHVCRASGHRFRVNDITCHPVLPLLVSTSHHNIPDANSSVISPSEKHHNFNKDIFAPAGFCSELILWRVDAVGPLCHSGGVSELARINSPEISAFSNVAWIPTLLPSTTLGSYSNSPSACFVASDGENLRVYQAVIDARTLLAEISSSESISRKEGSLTSLYSEVSSENFYHKASLHDKIKIVSQQSTARPGCIIQLDALSDAKHDWQNTQFLHVFQEQLITGERTDKQKSDDEATNQPGFMESQLSAMVDLQRNSEFEEPFYIVIIEKTLKGSTIHMWRIVISSKPQTSFLSESAMYVPDCNLTQDLDDPEITRRMSMDNGIAGGEGGTQLEAPHISIVTKKVCTQELPMPDGVDVIHASPSAGHLSSSSIYPACFAPYIIVTACSDSVSRFWKCDVVTGEGGVGDLETTKYEWSEWKMFSRQQDSAIEISGQPLNISAAYSGRVACAYKYGKSFTRPHKGDPDSRYINLCVAIYECESTGGSEWVLEDTIHLRNVHLPRINIDHSLDLSYLHDSRYLQKKQRLNQVIQTFTHEDNRSPRSGEITPELGVKPASGLLAVPSFSTLQSLRKSITENGNTCPLTQKHLVQLDWVSKEDGSHILTVAVGSKILLYTPVSSDLAQANMKAMKESRSANRPILRKSSSLAQPHFNDEIRWMKLRQIDLQTADGLPPLPMQISWVRDGILVVGMDSEMHVYSQWKPRYAQALNVEDLMDTRNLRDEDLRSLANETTQRRLNNVQSIPLMSKASTANLQLLSVDKKKKFGNLSTANIQSGSDAQQFHDYMTDYGLFQASRIACPVLPQYHPKQLMELLNSGKIRWVKAILAHLVRCMSGPYLQGGAAAGDDESVQRQRAWSRSRTLSISFVGAATSPNEPRGSTTQIPEELMLDYAEITSIPPLPLWVLLSADKEGSGQGKQQKEEVKDYDELFDMDAEEDNLDDLLDDESEPRRNDRRPSIPEKTGVAHFGPRQGQLLSRLLTHTHLPGLSSLDQMHLLALADTVATCNTDFSEKFAIDAAKSAIAKENSHNVDGGTGHNISTESLDDCALRFLLAMKHFSYLMRCLPLNQRSHFQKQGVGTSNIVWAFHSEGEEELLNLIPSYTKGELKWSTLKELGVGYWLKNITVLKQCIEKLAKSAYQSKHDPLDAALYYLAMKKKSIVWGLFRSQRDEKMTAFFQNNFSDDRWRKAALKNAFVLLGKQRFEHAVAFFLLANSLHDAIEVCLNKLEDFQLALVLTRLYEGELDVNTPSTYKKLINEHLLGIDADGQDVSKAHPDPFLRSIGFWILKNYSASLSTLLLNNVGQNHSAYKDDDSLKNDNSQSTNPNVFNFYIYLRTHPLLIRQHIASTAQEKKLTQVVLSGFSYAGDVGSAGLSDKQLQLEDSITPLERQLYFTTAHAHFKAGCPALALEVLNKLPTKVIDTAANSEVTTPAENVEDHLINTGIIDWSTPAVQPASSAADFDWGAPVTKVEEDDGFKIDWGEDETKNEDDDDEEDRKTPTPPAKISEPIEKQNSQEEKPHEKLDIMAQQLKFVACLKILMEELSTLATGFEVDGGQLRYQLYIWLEREVDALKQLCNYCNAENDALENNQTIEMTQTDKDNNITSQKLTDKPTLHEILMQEKQDFEAKVKRAARRKRWLKANETLLRTLLSYCSLHGASGGGLASVRMELVLLLQELQQEKTQQQLLSPLPFPTTLPLLSACVAGNKTVIADPIKYLQSHTQDMLQTVVDVRSPFIGVKENTYSEIFVLRDLAIALSSCIYQSLCDSESFVVSQSLVSNGYQSPGIENIAKLNASCQCSHLMVNANIYQRKRKYSTDEPAPVCTLPSKWPGVTNLRALLAREKDEDIPRLTVLLLEAFVATYMSLMVYALATCDCHILYRLIGQKFTNYTWSSLFGGGIKKLLRKATSQSHLTQSFQSQSSQDIPDDSSVWNTVTSITKQRVKLNMKLLGTFSNPSGSSVMKEDKPTYREQFVSPDMSMVSYFLIKPSHLESNEEDYDTDDSYASDEEEDPDDEEVFGDALSTNATALSKPRKDNTEHSNPMSYSWNVMRLALIKLTSIKLQELINIAGIENQELPVASPLTHEVLRNLNHWQEIVTEELLAKGPAPADYIPGCFVENEAKGPAIHKYRSLLEKHNTPFLASSSAGPARRLWNFLVRQEHVQDIFIRAVFGKKRSKDWEASSNNCSRPDSNGDVDSNSEHLGPQHEPIRIIHKDQESISAFCINNASPGLMAIATPREVQEMDISLLLESPNWCEDECEYDLLNLSKDIDSLPATGFLVIQAAADKNAVNATPNIQNYGSSSSYQPTIGSQSGRGTSVIKGANFPGCHDPWYCKMVLEHSKHLLKPVMKHKVDNVKRMSSHPLMPLYLTGGQDGSVQLWEWSHQQVVCTPRPPGTFAKVTRCRFSQQGNKFGIGDGDGNLSLWQAGIASQSNRSFFTQQCHSKLLADFVFLGSCSLVASAGHSSENKNVGIWDTLLPQKKSLVTSFTCHDQGASSLIYAPQHQVLISSGKKGDVCIFDVRQRTLRHRFQAHESAIKCMAMDPHEELFVTGSAEGDIKIWSLTHHAQLYTFSGEHAKSSFFKHIGQGVSQLQLDSQGRLFSCGSDGSMKVRQLSDRDNIVQSLY
ncbi:dmX-like protein 2 isoform X1 [Episyrphus balteatus]|uniref:dmX-like protein 2 isoform X1 n=1 Tax=Episyrphus balteatus TaxID=286459 RepID=UPI0024862680|nr:dmX-like protein 2 isoform X1 [Episyrphus balteatus]